MDLALDTDGGMWGVREQAQFEMRKEQLSGFRVQASSALNTLCRNSRAVGQKPSLRPVPKANARQDHGLPEFIMGFPVRGNPKSKTFSGTRLVLRLLLLLECMRATFPTLSSGALLSWCELFSNIPTLDSSISFPLPICTHSFYTKMTTG